MSEILCSVGLDVGTTSTQLIVSELKVENRASSFAVPDLQIVDRRIRYKSPVYFTPLLSQNLVDGQEIRRIVEEEYRRAGITREGVDTGAIIITGETSRKENARAVLEALSDLAGEFVVATAGPDLESVLAAKGAGAVAYSRQTGKRVLHMDIGGGTSNLALIEDGKIVKTGCLNVGGRLLKFDQDGKLSYVSPVLDELCKLKPGDAPSQAQVAEIARKLTQALEMAAGLREPGDLLDKLWTKETLAGKKPEQRGEFQEIATPVCGLVRNDSKELVISFSGGVADCIETVYDPLKFGDMGPALGRAIRESALCRGEYRLGSETIRATVIGAGCHSAQLSGSTVFYRDFAFPAKNLPVVSITRQEQEGGSLADVIRGRLGAAEADSVVLALPGMDAPGYAQVVELAEAIAAGTAGRPVLVCLEADMAKALGHALALRVMPGTPVLCIDRVRLAEESFLDVGTPVGCAVPIVVKTVILAQ